MRCPRCGNVDPSWFYLGSKGWYCRRCVGFSRRLACEAEEPAVPELSEPLDPQLRLDYPLTSNQKQISDQLCELSETHDVLVDAVCGAGKTEIVMDCLRKRLQRGQRAAVIGALAGEPRCQGSGSSRIHPWRLDSPWEALCKELPDAVYVPGYDLAAEESQSEQIAQALEAVRGKDIVYLFAGLPESWECEGFDRTHLRLPAGQEALIEAVCRENPRTVVILLSGGALELPWADRPGAILLAHLGGEAVGTAVAKLLLGDLSPSGKLAETFPLSLADTPPEEMTGLHSW